jgi:magnesium transporter|tara:strand:+ start:1156 stop:2115 length:960 start_codon:yes stop_codon:yes gene_type:complete
MIRVQQQDKNFTYISNIKDIDSLVNKEQPCWIDIENETNENIASLLVSFGCHELAVHDVLKKNLPPKFEDFEGSIFMLYKGIGSVKENLDIKHVQMGFFVKENLLISIHEEPSFGIEAAKNNKDLLKWIKTPLLLLCKILDSSALKYLDEILQLDHVLAEFEDKIAVIGTDDDLTTLTAYKTRLRRLRRIANYHEKIIIEIIKFYDQRKLCAEDKHHLKGLHVKFERIHSLTTMYYDMCGDLIDGYLSLTSHRLNKSMKILTVITAIFIPLGLLAGIYGMNFDNIPELHNPNGYFILIGVMSLIASTLLILFKKTKWLE